jgi:hypothetical protein
MNLELFSKGFDLFETQIFSILIKFSDRKLSR